MEKRYQVFLSSTYQDLSEERLEVIKALLELDCIPCGMEYFPAASEDSWSYISRLIEQCDYYVVVIGGRYGSLTDDGISFTQKEYNYAMEKGIPAIAFIHAKPENLPVKKSEQSNEGKEKLATFIQLLKRNLCKDWSTVHELGAVVSRSITQLIKRHPRIGWVPATEAQGIETTAEILQLTKRNRELELELSQVRGRAVADVSDLADGDDPIKISVTGGIRSKLNAYPWYRELRRFEGEVEVTWNDLFRAISPRIAPVANDTAVRSGISGLVESMQLLSPPSLGKDEWVSSLSISTLSFDVIKVQFQALGLVTIGKERDEAGKLGALLWRLTESGQHRMITKLAVKKVKGVER